MFEDNDGLFLVISSGEKGQEFYDQLAVSIGYRNANILNCSVKDAIPIIAEKNYLPKFLIIDMGDDSSSILTDLDALANYCATNTRVIVLGKVNDISLYRSLMERGILEYLTHPISLDIVRSTLLKNTSNDDISLGKVISFMGGGAGDGSSTIALNVAYAIAKNSGETVVLVDLDYQFGMTAKNLSIDSNYGIKDVFEHQERGIDSMLIERMAIPYKDGLDVISSPNKLRFTPDISANTVHELIATLRIKYKYVILDIPHLWNNWVASTITSSDKIILVAQLWLKSVMHCARFLSVWKNLDVENANISIIINRSGAKFKEAIESKDFEKACGHKINSYIINDIKTVTRAEDIGSTIIEVGNSSLVDQINELANNLIESLDERSNTAQFNASNNVITGNKLLSKLKRN